MKKKKIAFVINYFYPDLASTGQLMTDLCLFVQNDFDITVIAAQPGYAGEEVKTNKRIEITFVENIKVVRIKLPEVYKTSKLSRIKYIFSYFIWANIALLREKGVDMIYTISQPPVLGGLIGTIGKFLKRTKHIYNIQDFNPEQAVAVSYTNKQIIFKIAKLIDKFNCLYSDAVVVVGNDMSETLKKRFNHKNTPKHVVINNWTDEEEILPLTNTNAEVKTFIEKYGLEEKFIFMYSGNIGLYYDLENIIKVIGKFKAETYVAFVFIGDGAIKKEIEVYSKINNLENVYFIPYQPKEFIKYSLNAAHVHLVVNQKGIKGVSVPSKIYGVMAAGKPILGVLEKESEAEYLITKSASGITVEPKDYDAIELAIRNYIDKDEKTLKKMGQNGREYLEKYLKKEKSINKYRELFNDLLE